MFSIVPVAGRKSPSKRANVPPNPDAFQMGVQTVWPERRKRTHKDRKEGVRERMENGGWRQYLKKKKKLLHIKVHIRFMTASVTRRAYELLCVRRSGCEVTRMAPWWILLAGVYLICLQVSAQHHRKGRRTRLLIK